MRDVNTNEFLKQMWNVNKTSVCDVLTQYWLPMDKSWQIHDGFMYLSRLTFNNHSNPTKSASLRVCLSHVWGTTHFNIYQRLV